MAKAPKSVSESLWWNPFVGLFEELDRAPLSDGLPNLRHSQTSADKIKKNHTWFTESISGFKPPNEASKKVLESDELLVGPHSLPVKVELRESALKVSQLVNLDEVQSYILVDRSVGQMATVEYKELVHSDRAIAIVTELLPDAKKSKSLGTEVERVCILLAQVLDRSLYLELCVSNLCGVHPVLGRVEDFSREIKPMMHAIEHHKDFNILWHVNGHLIR